MRPLTVTRFRLHLGAAGLWKFLSCPGPARLKPGVSFLLPLPVTAGTRPRPPAKKKKRMEKRAKDRRRSLNQEIVYLVQWAIGQIEPDLEDVQPIH